MKCFSLFSGRNIVLIMSALCAASTCYAERGGANGGGGNAVGNELYDHVENKGVVVLKATELEAIMKPVIDNIRQKFYDPDFDKQLMAGIESRKWYLDPNPLKQSGRCLNRTVQDVKRVVVACQTGLAVRINKDFFLNNPSVRRSLITHELLVRFQNDYNEQLREDINRNNGWTRLEVVRREITDEDVRAANRALQDFSLSAAELNDVLRETQFAEETTREEKRAEEKRRQDFYRKCKNYTSTDPYHHPCDYWSVNLGNGNR